MTHHSNNYETTTEDSSEEIHAMLAQKTWLQSLLAPLRLSRNHHRNCPLLQMPAGATVPRKRKLRSSSLRETISSQPLGERTKSCCPPERVEVVGMEILLFATKIMLMSEEESVSTCETYDSIEFTKRRLPSLTNMSEEESVSTCESFDSIKYTKQRLSS